MDKEKEKDDSLGGSVSEATVTGSEHVDDASEIPVEPMACEGQGQIVGSFGEGVVGEEGGACNGGDIMVEVLGSDVFVDGVCTHEGGGGVNLNGEAGHGHDGSGKPLERDGKSLDDGGVVDDLDLQGIRVSGGELSNLGSECGFGGSLGLVELSEEQNQIVVVREEVAVEVWEESLDEKGTLNDEARNVGIGTGTEGSLADVGSMVGEPLVPVVEEVEMVVKEEGLEKGNAEEGAERGREAVGSGGYVTDEARVLGNEAWNGIVENDVDSRVLELSEEQNQVAVAGEEVAVKVREEDLVEKSVEEKGIFDDEARNVGIGTVVDGSMMDVGSMAGETQVLVVEEVEMAAREAGLEKGNVEEVAERGRETVGIRDDVTDEAGVLDNEARNGKVENGAGDSSVAADSSGGEIQPYVEEVAMESEETLEKRLVKEGAVQGGELVGGHDTVDDMETQKVGILDNEVWNPGIETAVSSSAIKENLSIHIEVVEEKATLIVNEEILNSKDVASGSDALEGIISSSERELISIVEPVCGGTEKDDFANANPESLDQHTRVVVGEDVAVADKEKFSCPKVEVMGTGVLDEDLSCSVEEQARVGTLVGSSENDGNVSTDLISSCQPNQVVIGGEVAAMDDKGLSNCEKDQQFKLEEYLEKSTAGDHSLVDSNVGQEMEVDKQVTVSEQVGLHEGQGIEVEEQQVKVESVNGNTDGLVSADFTSSCQLTQVVVGGEVASADDKVLSNLDVELSASIDLDGMLPCSREADTVCSANLGDTQVSDRGEEIAFMDNEVPGGAAKKDQELKLDECSDKSKACDLDKVDSNTAQEMEVDELVTDTEQVGLHGGQEIEDEEQVTDTEQPKTIEEKIVKEVTLKPGSLVTVHQASYQLPPVNEDEFSVSDLVWGKVRSHPWWPGQIFDPSDSSEKAMKYYKKDCFLVAYFGDRTFAWNDSSLLKPFRMHFSHIENQSNSEVFQNAVDCALKEVSRRVELGLACSCIPKNAYDKIKFQIVENTGIRQESSRRDGADKSASVNSFEPVKLVDYIKELAQFPSGGADRLELVVIKAQLLAFYRLKGYCQLPEFQFCGALLENDADTLWSEEKIHFSEAFEHATPVCEDDEKISCGQGILKTQNGSTHKRKHNLKDVMYPRKKERSLSELMGGSMDSPDGENGSDGKAISKSVFSSSGKKWMAADSFCDDLVMQDGRKSISFAKVTNTTPIHKQSFKIGECIQRVASQLAGSPSILKCNSERFLKVDGSSPAGDGVDVFFQDAEDAESGMMIVPTEYSSLDELLSQLHLAAQDPMKGYGFLNIIISFFSDFRNSVNIGQYSATDKVGGRRKKSSRSIVVCPETFEFEDMNDNYWTDMIIQNGSEEQSSRRKRKGEYQLVPVDAEKSPQVSRRSYSRKRYSDGNLELEADKPAWYLDERKRDSYPAELIMSFPDVDFVPSEMNLNKMFRCFGPLKDSETEVDRVSSRARVVFKRCSDAEVAFSSAGKFNIFGPTLVNYQLSYSPSTLFKASSIATIEGHEDAT